MFCCFKKQKSNDILESIYHRANEEYEKEKECKQPIENKPLLKTNTKSIYDDFE